MLTFAEELDRLAVTDKTVGEAVGFLEVFTVHAESPTLVIDRAREVMAIMLRARNRGAEVRDPAWSTELPTWFVDAHASEDAEWTLDNWLLGMDPSIRPWRWWSADGDELIIMIDGWPYPAAALLWLLRCAGARSVDLPV